MGIREHERHLLPRPPGCSGRRDLCDRTNLQFGGTLIDLALETEPTDVPWSCSRAHAGRDNAALVRGRELISAFRWPAGTTMDARTGIPPGTLSQAHGWYRAPAVQPHFEGGGTPVRIEVKFIRCRSPIAHHSTPQIATTFTMP